MAELLDVSSVGEVKVAQYGEIFLKKIDLLLNVHKKIMFFGDFNINLYNSSSMIDKYKDIIQSNGLDFFNSLSKEFPTRISDRFNSSSCIDHIFTDYHYHRSDFFYNLYYFDLFGDHRNMILNMVKKQYEPMDNKIKSYKIIDNNKILNSKRLLKINTDSFDEYVNEIKKTQ